MAKIRIILVMQR